MLTWATLSIMLGRNRIPSSIRGARLRTTAEPVPGFGTLPLTMFHSMLGIANYQLTTNGANTLRNRIVVNTCCFDILTVIGSPIACSCYERYTSAR